MASQEASNLLLEALRGHEEDGLSVNEVLSFYTDKGYERDTAAATVLNAIDSGKVRLGDRLRIFAASELETA